MTKRFIVEAWDTESDNYVVVASFDHAPGAVKHARQLVMTGVEGVEVTDTDEGYVYQF